ncbi:MAG: chromosome segregation protein SMC, partial [Pseudomonadales bacterium]
MRLQAIKLAGFKSFVDPTTVPFPANLCAVVGPNGCGKSNIIDAVRWVMGESSAKTLRGESMADVIFNGSNSRKPVGQASIELLFDNAEGQLGGEYSSYNELSIKREVSRDGQSNYYLNNQRCRRKDITDVFLGTGLGPRSYSIIEQGMISDLIEAKPEELRGYLEEAAGISKYKERRRETERRISHTRDNLDRLSDLREELERQILHLERQAKGAERYTELKTEERGYQADLHALRWQAITAEIKSKDEEITRLTTEREARTADQRNLDAQIETKRSALSDLSDELDKVQRRFYDKGTEIARIEESIQFQTERNSQLNADLEEVKENLTKVSADLQEDETQLAQLRSQLQDSAPRQEEIRSLEAGASQRLQTAEQAMADWQQRWDDFNHQAAETRQQGEVQQSRITHMEESIDRTNSRVATLKEDIANMSGDATGEELGPMQQMLQTQEQQLERIEQEQAALNQRIEQQRAENAGLTQSLDEGRSQLQSLKGRHASLEALQQAALGQQDDVEVQWLEGHGLGGQQRLAEKLQVADGWDLAVETVLGAHLQAVCVDGLDAVSALLSDFDKGHLNFIAQEQAERIASASGNLLADKVSGDAGVSALLEGVLTAASLDDAMHLRASLNAGESVVTLDGIWLGRNWLRVTKDRDAEAGVIKRQKELV